MGTAGRRTSTPEMRAEESLSPLPRCSKLKAPHLEIEGERIKLFLLLSDGRSGITAMYEKECLRREERRVERTLSVRSHFITRARKTTFPGFLSNSCKSSERRAGSSHLIHPYSAAISMTPSLKCG